MKGSFGRTKSQIVISVQGNWEVRVVRSSLPLPNNHAMRAIASSFESIAYIESQIALIAMTENAKEGLKASAEKRKPMWTGK